MNKYELGIKIDQIKKLAAKKDYAEAAAIAKELNWSKVKDWQSLATAINVQEAVGDYEEARDMAILAYNRNLGGRKLVYKLTEFFIKVGDFDNANELYEEYSRTSQHDVSRFILLYDLRRAQNASDNELVGILEDYRDHEIDEKYMYELAALYYKTGRKEECVKTCDNIVLWFQDGRYVEKAVQLKEKLGVVLTKTQKGILEDVKKRKDDIEATKEELFAKQKALIDLKRDDVEDVFREDEEDEAEENDDKEDIPEQPVFKKKTRSKAKEVHLNVPEYDREKEEGPLSMDLVQNDQNSEIKDFIMKALNKSDKAEADNQQTVSARKIETPQVEKPEVQETMTEDGEKSFSNEINKANLSLKELIANAKQKLENNYDKINKEDEAEQRREAEARINEKAKNIDINVPVPDYSLYDTKNLQEELAANMSDLFKADEEDEDVKTFVPASKHQDEKQEEKEPVKENATAVSVNTDIADEAENTETSDDDDQIEGQMDITEWMQSVREEKYGKQDTKEFSKSELERYLDEKDEKSAAYEKLVEQKKAEALADGKEIDKEGAKRAALAQMAVDSARMDLAIRTGKAAARLEQAATAIENEDIPLVTAQIPTVSESMISDINSIMNEDIDNKDNKEEGEEAVVLDEVAAGVEPEETVIPFTRQEEEQPLTMEEEIEETEQIEKKLTGELAKIFRKYRDMPGLEEQLADLFDTIDDEMQMNSSASGNILISGNSSSDKTDLARTIIRAINTLYPDQPKKIAKTSGESINQRGIAKAMGRLKGTALIVEGAGTIQPKRINELLNCLEQDTGRMIVIFEDSDTDMNVLINFNPELTKTFNHRIVLKQYTVNELVEMAKRFARKRQYEVDDDALLELYLKIDKLHNVNDNIKLDDIKEIINQAIVNSERRASRRFFGGLKKKRSENGDVIFLTEADFKDR